MTTITPTLEYLKDAAKDLIKYDSFWKEGFCENCCTRCPSDYDPMDSGCYRHDSLFDDDVVYESARRQMEIDAEWENPDQSTIELVTAISAMLKPKDELMPDNIVVLSELESIKHRMQDNLDTAIISLVGSYNLIVSALMDERDGGDAV